MTTCSEMDHDSKKYIVMVRRSRGLVLLQVSFTCLSTVGVLNICLLFTSNSPINGPRKYL